MDVDPDPLIEAAVEIALEHRSEYDAFFSELEHIIADMGAKVSGNTAASLLLSHPKSLQTYLYEIYVSGGFVTAMKIATRLYNVTANKSLVLNTDMKNTEFTIAMNARNLVKIYSQPQHHGASPVDMIKGVMRDGYFAKVSLETMPEEIILISYCRILYNPAQYKQWENAYKMTMEMWDAIKDQFISRVTGGAQAFSADITVAIPGEIIIGDEALVRMGLLQKRNRHTQIITEMSSDDVASIVSKNIKRPTNVVRHSISLPGDFQLTKSTIYAVLGDGKQRPVLEVFNSTAYEIVGVSEKQSRVGSHWTILRFLLLDLWLMKLVKVAKISSGTDTSGLDRINDIISGIARSAELLLQKVRTMDPARLFPATASAYIGVNVSEQVMRKKFRPKMSTWVPAKQL